MAEVKAIIEKSGTIRKPKVCTLSGAPIVDTRPPAGSAPDDMPSVLNIATDPDATPHCQRRTICDSRQSLFRHSMSESDIRATGARQPWTSEAGFPTGPALRATWLAPLTG